MKGALVAILLATVAVGAQQQTTFRVRRELVRVDVLVTDRGKPVAGLAASDFRIADNGVPQTVEVIGSDDAHINVAIVLDTSGSVSGDRLDRLRRATRSALATLKTGDNVALVGFSHVIGRGAALTGDLNGALESLNHAPTGGETSLYDASYAGLTLAESKPGRALLIVLSDGLDTASWLTPNLVLEAAKRSSVVVYGVSVQQPPPNVGNRGDLLKAQTYAELSYGASVPPAGPIFLRDLTAATGGSLFEVEASRNLDALFASVVSEFRARYLIGYSPSGVESAGWHRITVTIPGHPNLTVTARPGYQGPNN